MMCLIIWLAAGAIAAPIVGCVIAGRSVWSMFRDLRASWLEAIRSGQ
jgi:hypothetical protein